VSVLAVLPIAKELVLLFGPPEFFLLAVLGLVVVSTTSRGKMLRALLTGALGLMIAFIGYSDVTGTERFTLGSEYLWDGVHLVPALIGLFAVAEMIKLSLKGGSVSDSAKNVKITRIFGGLMETFRHMGTVIRGSVIGTVMGAIPGVGGVVASFLSYSMTVQASKDPESFGKGNIKGVIAPEAAINAKDCSALIPTLAFGIPSGAEMAVFLGLLVLHGMQPGPLMLVDHQVEVYGLIWALTASCVLASFVGLAFVRPLSKLTLVESRVLVPIVLCIAMVGSFAIDLSIENTLLTAVFGVLGYVMILYDYPRLCLVVALVLGPTAERNFHQSMMMSDGNWSIFVDRTISAILLGCIVVILLVPIARAVFRRRRPAQTVAMSEGQT
jgi:putative tricarboxylic transport membrane protein